MKVVIIDDEKHVRDGLKILLNRYAYIQISGEASNLEEAKTLIEYTKPDLIFLDIMLKNETGFDLLDVISLIDFKLVFITAYNKFAIKAFKYNAFDYLLKPLDLDELDDTLKRLQSQKSLNKTQIELSRKNKDFKNLLIKTNRQIHVLVLEDIVRCEADQGYTHFYMKDGQHILSSKTLKEYNNILPEDLFIRVHQSHLVNKKYILSYDKQGFVVLQNQLKIPVSVRKRSLVLKSL